MRYELLSIINGQGKREWDVSIRKICGGEQICHIRFSTKREAIKKINEYLRKC
jgi:hypothetical protein